MRALSWSLFPSVVSRAAGWLIATLFRRRALISIARVRDAISRAYRDRE
jgi:hypothetical protein